MTQGRRNRRLKQEDRPVEWWHETYMVELPADHPSLVPTVTPDIVPLSEIAAALWPDDGAESEAVSGAQNVELSPKFDVLPEANPLKTQANTLTPYGYPQPYTVVIGFDAEWTAVGDGVDRVLSYQWHIVTARGELSGGYLFAPGVRPTFREIVIQPIENAHRAGILPHTPKTTYLVAHFNKGDLNHLADFAEIAPQLQAVHKSLVTTEMPIPVKWLSDKRRQRQTNVYVRDTILLTDEKASLEQLGHTLGMPKLPLPSGARWDPATRSWQDPYTKARMDIFLQDRPAEFMRYGERDAVIAARYFTSLLVRFQKERLKFHVPRKGTKAYEKASERDFWNDPLMPATTGAWGVKELLHIWREHSLEIDKRKSFLTKDAVLGLVAASTYNQRTGRYHTKRVHTEGRSNVEDLAAKCYHGGRGEAFYYGLSPEDDWTDYDISGAYTASLSAVRMPDWDRAYHCLDPQEYTADTLGYALVNFEFPPDTLYPCLPVKDRLEPDSGMIFPLRGRTHATAPDIATALWIGARVEIVTGWIIPYVEDWIPFFGGYRPFADFTKVVRMRRAEAQAAGDMVGDKVWKLLGNSVYGKLGQGFRGTKAYNPETGKNELIGKCKITIAALAAHATGLTRAVMGEVLHRLPPGRTALNCVTDGLLTNALLEELHLEGPAGRVFKEAAGIVTPGAPVLEAKHTDRRVLVWRKRGHVGEGEDGVLAKGGLQADRDLSRTEVQAWVQQLWREREPDQRVVQISLDSLRTLMETGRDMQDVTRLVRLNMDFDMNRQPFEPRDEDGLLVFSTRPWNDLGEWRTERKRVRDWHKSGRILKSLADWKAFMGVRRRSRNHTKQPRVYRKTSS